jgi:hypothetical protein
MHSLILLGYFILSIALTWPLILHWRSGIVGGTGDFTYGGSFADATQNIWNMWWTRWALEHGQNPFWTDMLYYPEGVQMYLQTMNITNAFLTLPVHYLFGPVAAYNIAMLLAFTLTGYAGFLLVRAFVPGVFIPFFCGVLLTACPFHMLKLQVNQLNLVSIQWLPFYFLALIWLDRGSHTEVQSSKNRLQPDIRMFQYSNVSIFFAVVSFVMVALTDWYWALVCSLYTVIWFGVSYARSQDRWRLLGRYILFGVGVLGCLLPLFVGMIQTREHLPTTDVAENRYWRGYIQGFSSDAFGLLYPSAFQPFWSEWVQQTMKDLATGYGPDGWYVAAGWVLILCAALGVWWSWRIHWQLLVVSSVAWLLSLGPTLRVLGVDTNIPMPFMLIQNLPVLSAGRRPSHFAIICIVLAIIFAGIGLQHLQIHFTPQRARVVLIGIVLLAVVELWPPQQRTFLAFELPDFLYRLRDTPGAVADLPLEQFESSRSLQHQIAHKQPILAGFVARRPQHYPTLRYVPLYNQIGYMRYWPESDIIPLSHNALAAMQCYYPIRHVLITKDDVVPERLQELKALLVKLNDKPLQPSFEDTEYIWYELPLFQDKCQPFVYLGAGWHTREYTDTEQWRWAGAAGDIWLVNPFETIVSVTLHLRAEAPGGPDASRPVELWHDEQRIAAWQVERAQRDYAVVVQLPPGSNRLELRAPTTFDPQTERDVSIAVMELQIQDYYVNMQ